LALADVREELAAGSEPGSGEITGPHGIRVELLRQQALTRHTHSAASARAYNGNLAACPRMRGRYRDTGGMRRGSPIWKCS
jgi:hypothetical protein